MAKEFWDRSNILSLNNNNYSLYVKNLINEMLEQDIGKGDVTTDSLIDENKEIKAYIIAISARNSDVNVSPKFR